VELVYQDTVFEIALFFIAFRVRSIRMQMLGSTVGADFKLVRMNSCWKPVGISLRDKSPIGILLSLGVERNLSQSSSTVKGFKTLREGAACDGLRVSCNFFASVSSVSVLGGYPLGSGLVGALLGLEGVEKSTKWREYLAPCGVE
jgi:hypothetical protein